jgi:succinate dehydrogenase subunit C
MSRRPYVREIPKFHWFLRQPRYVRYMVRELSCVFIGAYTLLLMVGLARLAEGRAAYEAFLAALKSPLSIAFHVIALAFAVYHSVTWFNLTPKALPVQMGEAFLPDWVISGAHYAAWLLFSAALLYFAGAF